MINDYIRVFFSLLAFLGTPILIVSSFLGWRRRHRSELPLWRNRFGLVSMAITTLYWLAPFLLFLAHRMKGYGDLALNLSEAWETTVIPAMLLAAALAAALKGSPRAQTIAASVLVIVLLYAISVQ